VGSKAAWISSRDGLKIVGVGAKAMANTTLDSKKASRIMDRKENGMAMTGIECQKRNMHWPTAEEAKWVKDRSNKSEAEGAHRSEAG
jgi:hypothetical protein